MGNLIQSLEESQQGYQQHNPNIAMINHTQPSPSFHSWSLSLALLLLPVTAVSVGIISYQYVELRDAWLQQNQGTVEVVEVSAPLIKLSYPNIVDLKDSQIEVTAVDRLEEPVRSPQQSEQHDFKADAKAPVVTTSNEDDLLEGLDLSGLSPDIAQRLHAVMQSEEVQSSINKSQTSQDQTVELISTAPQWYGKLPALNFQTHLYSSDHDKRWVKVNSSEYQQGDWLAEGVKLLKIEPQACLIEFDNQYIRIPALYDWQG